MFIQVMKGPLEFEAFDRFHFNLMKMSLIIDYDCDLRIIRRYPASRRQIFSKQVSCRKTSTGMVICIMTCAGMIYTGLI